MSDADKPTNSITSGNELQLTGPHWTFIIELYNSHEVQQACLLLQDSFGVDVSFLLMLLWYARHGVEFNDDDIEVLFQGVAPWRSVVVKPLRTMRREIKAAAGHDSVVAGYRNKIKAVEIEAEQIEIATLKRAVDQRGMLGLPATALQPASIVRIIEMALAFYATRAAAPAAQLQAPEVRAAIKLLADAALSANSKLR
jgi:uncharacterized protein (TIGR02444 family)